jgi:hypothetical protein
VNSRRQIVRKTNGPILARFFSSGVLKELARTGYSQVASNLVHHHHVFDDFDVNLSVGEFYNAIFDRLVLEYRYEYIYKNAIAEKILLGKHSLNTAYMLTEFRADNCKADAVVLNGTSHVYEIKSELDSYERIDRQIEAYKKIFDYITVITTEKLYDVICNRVPPGIGVMVLAENKYRFKLKDCRREAKSNKFNVNPSVIFESLHRKEYTKIIREVLGKSFEGTANTKIHSEAKDFFSNIPPEIAHQKMVEALKNRRQAKNISEFICDVPHSLKAASISMRLTKDERCRFADLMNSSVRNVFV